MSKKERIKELEAELRILNSRVYICLQKTGRHAHHNKIFIRRDEVLTELIRISIKWKLKKIFRRIKYYG